VREGQALECRGRAIAELALHDEPVLPIRHASSIAHLARRVSRRRDVHIGDSVCPTSGRMASRSAGTSPWSALAINASASGSSLASRTASSRRRRSSRSERSCACLVRPPRRRCSSVSRWATTPPRIRCVLGVLPGVALMSKPYADPGTQTHPPPTTSSPRLGVRAPLA
jgi:hypothetical protein